MTRADDREPGNRDPLIESCLEEILAGKEPPDLKDQILAALEARRGASEPAPPPVAPPVQRVATPRLRRPAATTVGRTWRPVRHRVRRRGRQASAQRWWWATVGISLVLAMAGLTWFAAPWRNSIWNEGDQPVVDAAGDPVSGQPNRRPVSPRIARQSDDASDPPLRPLPQREFVPPEQSPEEQLAGQTPVEPSPQGTEDGPRSRPPQPLSDEQVVQMINEQIQQRWQQAGVQPAAQVSSDVWYHRLFQALLGREPSRGELAALARNPSPQARQELLDRLLSDPRYREEYAAWWATKWCHVLLGRQNVTHRTALRAYLREALRQNRPYDQLVRQLLTAGSSVGTGTSDSPGAAAFLLSKQDARGILAAAETCRIFLASRLQCAQCHDDPHGHWSQEQFWQLTAFFQSMQGERRRGGARLTDTTTGESRAAASALAVRWRAADGTERLAQPILPDGTAADLSASPQPEDLRAQLADWICQSEAMRQGLVNRVWSHFFGFGFTTPVDDLGPHNPPSHPQLLVQLAEQFELHGHDVQKLIRWIVLSDAYQLAAVSTPANEADNPGANSLPLFSRYYLRPASVPGVSVMLAQAHDLGTSLVGDLRPAQTGWVGRLSSFASPGEEGAAPSAQGSLLTGLPHAEVLQRIARSSMTLEQKIDHLFQIALGRLPTSQERDDARALGNGDAAALQRVWWALVNSDEFIYDH